MLLQGYKLLRTAAGIFEFVRDHCATFMINATSSPDCNVQVDLSPDHKLKIQTSTMEIYFWSSFLSAWSENPIFSLTAMYGAQTAQAYALLCIAEAQSLTMLRAIQKGNAPSLIASLAVDAAAAFDSAAGTARGVAAAAAKSDCKSVLYADYQAAVHHAYGKSFAGAGCELDSALTSDTLLSLCMHGA